MFNPISSVLQLSQNKEQPCACRAVSLRLGAVLRAQRFVHAVVDGLLGWVHLNTSGFAGRPKSVQKGPPGSTTREGVRRAKLPADQSTSSQILRTTR